MFEVKAQSVVAQSSTEAEIIAMALAVRRVHYITDFLAELGFASKVVIYEDNNGTLANVKGYQMNDAVKHIRTKFWFIRESCRKFDMRKVHTFWQLADIGTKIHPATTWLRLKKGIESFNPSVNYPKLTPDDTI